MRPVDSTVFFNVLSHVPWINDIIAWGPTQPPPGTIPFSIAGDSCRLDLYARHPKLAENERFGFIDYFERLRIVKERCLKGNPDHNWGMTDIGEDVTFVAYLAPA